MSNSVELRLLYWAKWLLDQKEFKEVRERATYGDCELIYDRISKELKKHGMDYTKEHLTDNSPFKYNFPFDEN